MPDRNARGGALRCPKRKLALSKPFGTDFALDGGIAMARDAPIFRPAKTRPLPNGSSANRCLRWREWRMAPNEHAKLAPRR